MPRFPLAKSEPVKAPRRKLGAFDIETRGLGGEILAVGWQVEGEAVRISANPQDLVSAFFRRAHRDRRVVWYGHNAGGFDLLHLMPYLRETGAEIVPIFQGRAGRCIGMVLTRGRQRLELRDSMAIFPKSLADMTKTLCPEMPKLTGAIDFETETFDIGNPTHQAYLTRDVESLLLAVTRIWEIVRNTFQVWPKWTLGSTALRAWTLTLGESEAYWPMRREVEDFCRSAYTGGLPFIRWYGEKHNITAVDVNAMYPAVMRENLFPVGTPWKDSKFDARRLGIYRVKAEVPLTVKLPILPVHHKSGVRWPTGSFEAWVTSAEIKYARELGCRVDIIEGYIWPDQQDLFSEFVNTAEQLRRQHTGDAVAEMVKILQNSLYGKFGARREGTETLITDDWEKAFEEGYQPMIRTSDGEIQEGIWHREKEIDASYIQPHWATFVTAYARIKLHKLIMAIGVDQTYYGDTDSAWCDTEAVNTAIANGSVKVSEWHYGDVKLEGPFNTVEWVAAKVYAIRDNRGELQTVKAKGIPRRQRLPGFAARDLQVHWESVSTMKTFLKGAAISSDRKRGWSDIRSSLSWRLSNDGHTVIPWHVSLEDDLETERRRREREEASQRRLELRELRRELRGRILTLGGLAAPWAPLAVRRKLGQPPDRLADELGYSSADQLRAEIDNLYQEGVGYL